MPSPTLHNCGPVVNASDINVVLQEGGSAGDAQQVKACDCIEVQPEQLEKTKNIDIEVEELIGQFLSQLLVTEAQELVQHVACKKGSLQFVPKTGVSFRV